LILVVEDNSANQMLIGAVLEAEGFMINFASSAREALESIQVDRPELILMDIQLPGQDGLSLTRQIKADPEQASIPIVAITAHAMPGDSQLGVDAGCVGYITKPFDTRLLGSQVAGFLLASRR
jgi:CheY-like chemotaxis protein